MKNVVFSFVYPKVEPFLKDYIKSLNDQTTDNFEVYLFNDHFKNLDKYLHLFNSEVKVINIEENLSVVETRKFAYGFFRKQKDIKNLIFTDADDYFDKDRIELALKYLEKYDMVINDLTSVEMNNKPIESKIISKRITKDTITFHDISDKNFLGLSNLAIRAECIKEIYPIDKSISVSDWWIASSLLSKNKTCYFMKDTVTYYRQHPYNRAGMKDQFTEKEIQKSLKIKLNHYASLLKHLEGKNKQLIQEQLEKTKELKKELSEEQNLKSYLEQINNQAKKKRLLWWEY